MLKHQRKFEVVIRLEKIRSKQKKVICTHSPDINGSFAPTSWPSISHAVARTTLSTCVREEANISLLALSSQLIRSLLALLQHILTEKE